MWVFVKDRFINLDTVQCVRIRDDNSSGGERLPADVILHYREGYSETFTLEEATLLLDFLSDRVSDDTRSVPMLEQIAKVIRNAFGKKGEKNE